MKKIISWLIGSIFLIPSFAQKPPKRINILPFPVVYYLPETQWAYGVAITSTFRFKQDSATARPSQISIGIVRTQLKQLAFYLPFQVFLKNAQYYTYGEVGAYRYNFYYFGIGKQTISQELYGVDFPRIKLNFLKKIRPNLYAGIRYQYEDYKITSTEPTGDFSKGLVPGAPRNQTSGVGLGLLLDTRNMIFFPTKGKFIDVAYFHNPTWLGSSQMFDRLSVDASFYTSRQKNLVWATNLWGITNWGNVPFNMMAELGGPKKMRGYYQGRFRDKNLLLWQNELRFDIYKRLGATVFGSVGMLGDEKQLIRTNDLKYSYGGGLRFTLNRKEHLNLRIDYGIGKEAQNFYLTIGEAF